MRIATTNKRASIATLIIAAALTFLLALPALAQAAPRWKVDAYSSTTAKPGEKVTFLVQVSNLGDADTSGQIEWRVDLPEGMSVDTASGRNIEDGEPFSCFDAADGVSQVLGVRSITCKNESVVPYFSSDPSPFQRLYLTALVEPSASGTLVPSFEVSGGGAAGPDTTVDPLVVAAEPPPFGIDALDIDFSADPSGAPLSQAGAHPYDTTTGLDPNTETSANQFEGAAWPIEPLRDVIVDLPPGLIGNPTVADECTLAELTAGENFSVLSKCPPTAQVGTIRVRLRGTSLQRAVSGPLPLFNMAPPPGAPARFGFDILGTVVVLDARLRFEGDYGLSIESKNIPQTLGIAGTSTTFWGVPSAAAHDRERACSGVTPPYDGGGFCLSGSPQVPFLRMPTSCTETPTTGLPVSAKIDSWEDPGDFESRTVRTHEGPGYPLPEEIEGTRQWGEEVGVDDCSDVPVKGELKAQPTSIDTQTPSGLEVQVEVPNPGLDNPSGIASSDIKRVKVTLPEGMSVNPSQAEGLGACSPAQYESTALSFYPSDASGCPSDSKIGTVSVKTPLLEETIPGEVFIASPYDNPFGSLLALYVVLEEPQRGVLIKLAGKVDTDPVSGQITTTFDDLPQLPFDSFDFRFREGARAPLVTPQSCGKYTTTAQFTGHSDPNGTPVVSESSFDITRGIGGGPCPSGGLPPFRPGLQAGSVNPIAGAYSPFNIRLFRSDSEQEMVNFSIKLPPGIAAKLAGVPFCPDSAIEASKTRSGADELASPSCPAASQVGRTLVGAGVGSVQTYVPGKVYLAGPYNGSALSIAAITAAKVGPFDLGTVVVRQALKVDPETAEVFVDATGSDPIPHIIDGIATHIRDIRAYVDKSEFALNPTSCDPTSTASTVLGSGLDFGSSADDRPVTVSTRYQVADCAALAFKPKLSFFLKGATKRGGNPSLRAVLKMPSNQANIQAAQVTLPRSEFLDQGHIGTVCTRVQYAADQCPPRSVYGYARAFTPILDEPLQGPVYLSSSSHKLPDLVAGLKSGKIEIDLVGRIDSPDGRIRNTFETVPDAPVSKFVLTMRGGKKSLLENSTNLCKGTHRAAVAFDAHNGKISDYRPVVRAKCGKGRKAK